MAISPGRFLRLYSFVFSRGVDIIRANSHSVQQARLPSEEPDPVSPFDNKNKNEE